MIFIRILLLAFNVAAVTYLVYRMLQIYSVPMQASKKTLIIATGVFLIILPTTIIAGIIRPSFTYLFVYPVVISLFVYLIRTSTD